MCTACGLRVCSLDAGADSMHYAEAVSQGQSASGQYESLMQFLGTAEWCSCVVYAPLRDVWDSRFSKRAGFVSPWSSPLGRFLF